MTTGTYGVWQDMADVTALSYQQMTLDAADLAKFWRRCSLSSDFWARYTALFAPALFAPARRDSIENLLSYLLNELFENCAKFSGGPIGTVRYQAWIQPNAFDFQILNHIAPERHDSFVQFIQELLENDPDELYFRRLEENAETDAKGSGLGYLTLMKDYGVRFGFRFSPVTAGSVAVEVQAHINLEEI
jgi:hypothetical protein